MNVCVVGRGHFACIVAVVLASERHTVTLSDEVPALTRGDQIPPDDEPGYLDLMRKGLGSGRLRSALSDLDLYWIAYDVPLDATGAPDTGEVERRIIGLDSRVPKEVPFLVSCQWPVGTTRRLAAQCKGREFVYVMENVRAGKAVADFQADPLPVVGIGQPMSNTAFVFMRREDVPTLSWETAEMAKHATNAFMALQIAFANEIAAVCGKVGAFAADVMQSVMHDARVSNAAPLRPGRPFGGGSLKRDLLVLEGLSDGKILHAIRQSNDSRS